MTINDLAVGRIGWDKRGAFREIEAVEVDDDEALVIQVEDGRIFVLAETNTSLGICDDCTNREIENLEVRRWKKIKFGEADF